MAEEHDNKAEGLSKASKPVPGEPVTSGSGLLQTASASEVIKAREENEEAVAKAEQALNAPQFKRLELYLQNIFEDARKFKEDETDTQKIMIDSLNRRNGRYDQAKLNKLQAVQSSEVFIGVTGVKCRAFESWVHDIYMNAKRKRTWDLKPTPIPDIPPEDQQRIIAEVMAAFQKTAETGDEMTPEAAYEMASEMRSQIIQKQYAQSGVKAENMSRKIHDQLLEGGWIKAFSDVIMDISTSKAGIIKGPIVRRRKTRTGWEEVDGVMRPKIELSEMVTFERVSPLDLYPGRANETVDDGPLVERVQLSRGSLAENRNEPGYITKNIEHVILKHTDNLSTGQQALSHQQERDDAERRDTVATPPSTTSPSVSGLEFWCRCPARDLVEFNITKDINGKKLDPMLDYDINAITVDGVIVYAALNEDPLERRFYSVYGYAKEIGGFWHMGIPELIKNEQDIANAAGRSMVNNLGISSGPQVVIDDIRRIPAGEDITSMYPWKIWQGENPGSSNAPLVNFFQPDSRSNELLAVMNAAISMTDNTLEMPAYSYGSDKVAGAGRTASGLSMLMSGSNRGLKRVLLGIDRYIFQTVVERMYDWNMQNINDPNIKGDMNFLSDGVVAMIMREQLSERRMGLLQATNNEFDMKILGLDGRAKILGGAIEALESDYDDIKPSEEKIARLIQEETVLQQQQIEKNQIEIEKEQAIIEREAQVALEEVQLAKQELVLKAREQDIKDRNMNRELDIRAAKQGEGLIDRIMATDEPEPGAPAK